MRERINYISLPTNWKVNDSKSNSNGLWSNKIIRIKWYTFIKLISRESSYLREALIIQKSWLGPLKHYTIIASKLVVLIFYAISHYWSFWDYDLMQRPMSKIQIRHVLALTFSYISCEMVTLPTPLLLRMKTISTDKHELFQHILSSLICTKLVILNLYVVFHYWSFWDYDFMQRPMSKIRIPHVLPLTFWLSLQINTSYSNIFRPYSHASLGKF